MGQKNSCKLCGSLGVASFLKRERVPVYQNQVFLDRESAAAVVRGDFRLMVCQDCGFIFNQTFDPDKISYNGSYDNAQDYSPVFEKYLSKLVRHLIFEKQVQNRRILEIGCGQGRFLRKLIEPEGYANLGLGLDPAYVGPLNDLGGRLEFKKSFFDSTIADSGTDVLICRHVIEHVPDPLGFLGLLRRFLKKSKKVKIFFETPSVEWILGHGVFWDFFYEHCSYFSKNSLKMALEIAGFKVLDVQRVFQSQYLWIEAEIAEKKPVVTKSPGPVPMLVKKYISLEEAKIFSWLEKMDFLGAFKKLAIWGAGAKGVTFANLLDPDCQRICGVVDINPKKQGHFLSGTGHPIIHYHQLASLGVEQVFLMNPNYRQEVSNLLQKSNLKVKLLE